MRVHGSRTLLFALGMAALASPAQAQTGRMVVFAKDVLPILQNRCTICHSARPRGGLKLDSYENLMQGGGRGPSVVAGNPQNSRLIQMVEGRVQPRMPQGGAPLSQLEIAVLRAWVQQGAKNEMAAPGAQTLPTSQGGSLEVKPLKLVAPVNGATVKERVRLVIPRDVLPPGGFISIYVDKKFKVAIAPESPEELEDKKLPADAPLTYVWDTKLPLVEDSSALATERFPVDGPHTIEVVAHKPDGGQLDRVLVQVILKNSLALNPNQRLPLYYGGTVGTTYRVEHTVDLDATASSTGFRTQQPGVNNPNVEKLLHQETCRYLISLEDVSPATGIGFWRERRESPITVTVNGVKNEVRMESASRYYSMNRRGVVIRSAVMDREKRDALINPLELPGRMHRVNEPFTTSLRINLGAYIPATLTVDNLQATVDGIEWQYGEPCVRLKVNYLAGSGKLDINSVSIRDAKFDIQSGTSTIWFSQTTKRVLRAKHELSGALTVDTSSSEFGGGMGGFGGAGGELGPGSMGGFGGAGMPGPPPPPQGMGAGGGGFGSPFGGAGGPGMMAPGMGAGMGGPGMGAGGGGFGSPFGGAGGPGMMAPGMGAGMGGPGMPGGEFGGGYGGGLGMGGGTGLAQRQRRFHVKLKVQSALYTEPENSKK